jgi:hypothetical protein
MVTRCSPTYAATSRRDHVQAPSGSLLERVEAAPEQFAKYGLLAVSTERGSLFFDVHKAVLPRTFPYVVFFYLRGRVAVVLAVAHVRRRPGYWMGRVDG